ncbi:hypothetical protein P7L64_00040 (plasmid) [Tistrella bauzanensis]
MPSESIFDSSLAGGVVGALAPAAGLTALSSGALGFLSGATGPKAPTWPVMIAWVPTDVASTSSDVVDSVVGAIETANVAQSVSKFVPDVSVSKNVERTGKNKIGYRIDYSFITPLCEKAKRCGYQLNISTPKEISPIHPPSAEHINPGILSTSGFPDYSYVPDKWGADGMSVFPDYDIMRDFSSRLPNWIYLYFPANTVAYRKDENRMGFLKYPIILHQGKILFFVKNQ